MLDWIALQPPFICPNLAESLHVAYTLWTSLPVFIFHVACTLRNTFCVAFTLPLAFTLRDLAFAVFTMNLTCLLQNASSIDSLLHWDVSLIILRMDGFSLLYHVRIMQDVFKLRYPTKFRKSKIYPLQLHFSYIV